MALGNLLGIKKTKLLESLKIKIYKYIEEHENDFVDIDKSISLLSKQFDREFSKEFTNEMKIVQYILIYHIYASGGEL